MFFPGMLYVFYLTLFRLTEMKDSRVNRGKGRILGLTEAKESNKKRLYIQTSEKM